MAGGWVELVQAGSGDETRGVSAILHEGAHCQGVIEILSAVHEDRTK